MQRACRGHRAHIHPAAHARQPAGADPERGAGQLAVDQPHADRSRQPRPGARERAAGRRPRRACASCWPSWRRRRPAASPTGPIRASRVAELGETTRGVTRVAVWTPDPADGRATAAWLRERALARLADEGLFRGRRTPRWSSDAADPATAGAATTTCSRTSRTSGASAAAASGAAAAARCWRRWSRCSPVGLVGVVAVAARWPARCSWTTPLRRLAGHAAGRSARHQLPDLRPQRPPAGDDLVDREPHAGDQPADLAVAEEGDRRRRGPALLPRTAGSTARASCAPWSTTCRPARSRRAARRSSSSWCATSTCPTSSRSRARSREAYLAMQMADQWSKDKILTEYLNIVPYGAVTYGCEAAALRYFNRHCTQLNMRQAALLAGLPQNPIAYNPLSTARPPRRGATRCWRRCCAGDITQQQYRPRGAPALGTTRRLPRRTGGDRATSSPGCARPLREAVRPQHGTQGRPR